MKRLFGYIRVSTTKQGEHGVSLQEQRAAIERYAGQHGITIADWLEERQTAAKQGRPVFQRMLALLKARKADGFIVHKLDRSTRNLVDWIRVAELADQGVDVRFANEGLDLHTRGGRLAADIQAVVATDYIRNLRDEARKGMYGRLRQGIYPLAAPIGYVDKGGGKPKELDPIRAPLVRKAFELYATGCYSFKQLGPLLHRLGLRRRKGGRMTLNGLSTMLNNPFYVGLMHLRRTNETFPGIHQPLIRKALFERVQLTLKGKTVRRVQAHDFLFRRLLTCAHCGYSLIGERQKGYIYYRCHTSRCATGCIREESVEEAIREAILPLQFNAQERKLMIAKLAAFRQDWSQERHDQTKMLKLRSDQLQDRLARLTDAYLDGTLEKELFEERKRSLLLERAQVADDLRASEAKVDAAPDRMAEFLELANTAYLLYETANLDEKRELLQILTSNRVVSGKNVVVELALPFSLVAGRVKVTKCPLERDGPRTVWSQLVTWFVEHPSIRFSLMSRFGKSNSDDSWLKRQRVLPREARNTVVTTDSGHDNLSTSSHGIQSSFGYPQSSR